MRPGILIKRIIIYFLLVLAAFLMQTCLFPLLGSLAAMPNLLLIVTFSYGFIYGSMTGMVCGVFAGFLMDASHMQPFGMFMLIFCAIGYFSGSFREELRTDSLFIPLVLCFIDEIFYNAAVCLYRFLATGSADIGYMITEAVIPETFFSMIITMLVYRILLNTNRKLDSRDELRGRDVA